MEDRSLLLAFSFFSSFLFPSALQFDTKKKLESAYKVIRFNKASVSAIESKGYNERFANYMDEISI